MTKGRLVTCLWIFLLLVLPLIGWRVLRNMSLDLGDPIGPAGYGKIRLGMTLSQVETAIGLPTGDYDTKHVGSGPGPFGRTVHESGIPGSFLPDAAEGQAEEYPDKLIVERWKGNDHWIWVAFNESEEAVGFYLLESYGGRERVPTEGQFDRVCRWLGLVRNHFYAALVWKENPKLNADSRKP